MQNAVATKRKRRENVVTAEKKAKLEEKQKKTEEKISTSDAKNIDEGDKVLIVDRLNSRALESALQELVDTTDENDLVGEFFSGGGQVSTLLRLLDLRENKVRANDVELVFRACQTVIIKVVRSENPSLVYGGRGLSLCQELTKRILEDYGKEINILLSGQNTTAQAIAVLRLLTSMVTLGVSSAKLLLQKLDWESINWDSLPKRTSHKDNPDVRTCFIHFLLAFLMEPNQIVLKEFFERKTRLSSIFVGLLHDTADTVQLVLETFRCKILLNPGVSKTYKMRLFGANNLKPLLALFNWTGPKASKKAVVAVDEEELEEVKQSLTDFLRVLLASSKFGVVFQDPEYGCEKNANPLVGDVLAHLTRPWESPDLAKLAAEILSGSPDQIPAFIAKMSEDWSPRSSALWTKLMDFLYVVFNSININSITDNLKKTKKVAVHLLRSIVLPLTLVDEVLIPGLASEHENVSRQSLELLDVLLRNTERLVAGSDKQVLVKELRYLMKDRLPDVEVLSDIWKREINCPDQKYIPHILAVITFHTRYCGSEGQSFNIVQILHDLRFIHFKSPVSAPIQSLETLPAQSSENAPGQSSENALDQSSEIGPDTAPDPRIQTLKIVIEVLNAEKHLSGFLNSFLSEETFSVLLECTRSGREEEKGVATSILETLASRTGICLQDNIDLQIVLGLSLDKDVVGQLARVLHTAVANQDQMLQEIHGYRSHDLAKSESMLDELMQTPHQETAEAGPAEAEEGLEGLSPLVIALLEAEKDDVFTPIVERVVECLLLLVQDKQSLYLAATLKSHIFGKKFLKRIQHYHTGVAKVKMIEFLTAEMARESLVFGHVLAAKRAWLAETAKLDEFLSSLEAPMCAKVVTRLFANQGLYDGFSPFLSARCSSLVVMLLRYRNRFNIGTDKLAQQVINLAVVEIEAEAADTDFDGASILETFSNLALPPTDLVMLLDKLASSDINQYLDSSMKLRKPGYIISAVMSLLARSQCPVSLLPADIMARLSTALEFLLFNSQEEVGQSLCKFIGQFPSLSLHLETNLLFVCCAKLDSAVHQDVICCLVNHSDSMMEEFKGWLMRQKKVADLGPLLGLLERVLGQDARPALAEERKLTKVVVKHLLSSAGHCLTSIVGSEISAEFAQVVGLLTVLQAQLNSDKIKKSLADFLAKHKETLRKLTGDPSMSWESRSLLSQFNYVLLTQAAGGDGSSKKDLLNLALVPAIQLVVEALKSEKQWSQLGVVCRVGVDTCVKQTHGAIKNYLLKHKAEWSAFIKGVLKHGLKNKAVGEPCLAFLRTLCSSRYKVAEAEEAEHQNQEDLEEMRLVVDMLVSHSGYLPTILGPNSQLKVLVVELMDSLAPASCSQEQLSPLLSGYTATLVPSDRAILKLLCTMENHGVRVGAQKPIMFGRQAVRQFGKAGKVSECLAALNRDLMTRTVDNFPLDLILDPTQDCDIPLDQEPLYDPRFILPYLSSLTGDDVFVDRHMKLVESGALSLAVMSLASQDSDIRSMGYHILHRFYVVMESGKLVSEKQVWLHLINSIKNGLTAATENKVCLKLPAVTTLFIARCIPIISNPTHYMYNSISGFLLAKPVLNLYSVPEFLRLFHSKELTSRQHQTWILSVLRDGLRDRVDHQMFVQSYVYKLVLSYLGSCLSDRSLVWLVLEVLERGSQISKAGFDLVSNHGILQYLAALSSGIHDKQVCGKILSIVRHLSSVLEQADIKKEDDDPLTPPKTTLTNILKSCSAQIRNNFDGRLSRPELDAFATALHIQH